MFPQGRRRVHAEDGATGAKPAPSKFAIPLDSVVDASLNPGVYPFGAILVTIQNVPNPWLFSFFTEREAALKCIRSARGYRGGEKPPWRCGKDEGARRRRRTRFGGGANGGTGGKLGAFAASCRDGGEEAERWSVAAG